MGKKFHFKIPLMLYIALGLRLKFYTLVFQLEEIQELSGRYVRVFTIKVEGQKLSFFEEFLNDYRTKYENDIGKLISRLLVITQSVGMRENLFIETEESDTSNIYELYADEDSQLKLLCCKNKEAIIILGGGLSETTMNSMERRVDALQSLRGKYWIASGKS